jgi:hypothetical protein
VPCGQRKATNNTIHPSRELGFLEVYNRSLRRGDRQRSSHLVLKQAKPDYVFGHFLCAAASLPALLVA